MKSFNFQSFLLTVLTENAANSALADSYYPRRRPRDDIARSTANAACRNGKNRCA